MENVSDSFWSIESDGIDLVGGKGASLYHLQNNNLPVPPFTVITTKGYQYWRKNQFLPECFIKEIKELFAKWDCQYVSIRSSVPQEDGIENSFAGLFETYLYVTQDNIVEYIIKCFESLKADRVLAYLDEKDLNIELQMAVVVQKMITASSSGVCFSRNPMGNSALILIESSYGLGEGVVSGQVEVDQFYIDRFNLFLKEKIATKKCSMQFTGQRVELVEVSSDMSQKPSLTRNEVEHLARLCLQLEFLYKCPVDIEWCLDQKDCFYLLQCRPITQNFKPLEYYCDTNLSESYPQFCYDFTCSVVPVLYENTFLETCTLLGGRKKIVDQLRKHYKALIQSFSGHLYYHLSSYYSSLYVLPGKEKNIQNWHRMIGGELKLINIDYEKISTNTLDTIANCYSLIKVLVGYKKYFSRFYKNAAKIRSLMIEEINQAKCDRELLTIVYKLIHTPYGFGLTAINDLFIMKLLDLFEVQSQKKGWQPDEIAQFLRTEQNVDSVHALEALNSILLHDEIERFLQVWKEQLAQYPDASSFSVLNSIHNQFAEISHKVENYLKKYGDRSLEELKFESQSFSQSAQEFYDFMNWLHTDSNEKNPNSHIGQRELPKVYGLHAWIGKKLHQCIKERENSRLVRGQFYALIRRAFFQLYEMNKAKSLYAQLSPKDYFYLTLQDIIDYRDFKIDERDLLNIILKRKELGEKSIYYPEFFASDTVSENYFNNEDDQLQKDDGEVNYWQGQGVSVGICEGEALVIESPKQAYGIKDLSNKILITRNTDPAWVFVMSKCMGLVSEKGSILSHTAIIGRELGIPTIVGVKEALRTFKSGDKIQLDAHKGIIQKK